MSEADDLLRDMDREGDMWYGRVSSALQDQRQRIAQMEARLAASEKAAYDIDETIQHQKQRIADLDDKYSGALMRIDGLQVTIAQLEAEVARWKTEAQWAARRILGRMATPPGHSYLPCPDEHDRAKRIADGTL